MIEFDDVWVVDEFGDEVELVYVEADDEEAEFDVWFDDEGQAVSVTDEWGDEVLFAVS